MDEGSRYVQKCIRLHCDETNDSAHRRGVRESSGSLAACAGEKKDQLDIEHELPRNLTGTKYSDLYTQTMFTDYVACVKE